MHIKKSYLQLYCIVELIAWNAYCLTNMDYSYRQIANNLFFAFYHRMSYKLTQCQSKPKIDNDFIFWYAAALASGLLCSKAPNQQHLVHFIGGLYEFFQINPTGFMQNKNLYHALFVGYLVSRNLFNCLSHENTDKYCGYLGMFNMITGLSYCFYVVNYQDSLQSYVLGFKFLVLFLNHGSCAIHAAMNVKDDIAIDKPKFFVRVLLNTLISFVPTLMELDFISTTPYHKIKYFMQPTQLFLMSYVLNTCLNLCIKENSIS